MKDIGSFPEFLQDMEQVQDQSDVQRPVHLNLEGALTVGQSYASFGTGRITACHLLGHLVDEGRLAVEQTGPHALVLGARRRWGVARSPAAGGNRTFQRLLRSA